MKQASWQVPKVNSFPPLQQLFKLKSFFLFALVHHHPLLPTIRKDNRLGKCSKEEGGGYKVATEGKPFFLVQRLPAEQRPAPSSSGAASVRTVRGLPPRHFQGPRSSPSS